MTEQKNLHSFTTGEVKKIFKNTKAAERAHTHVLLIAPAKKGYGRLLACTPRKIGSAPQRNLVRRRLKAIWREEGYYNLPIDCIVIVRPGGADLTYDEWRDIMKKVPEWQQENVSPDSQAS